LTIPRIDGLAYGGDYNPEQWDEATWDEDVRLMREARVNLVTVGVFSWSVLQTSRDTFEFGWLDRVMDLLHANGIAVDLATATASPPPWLTHEHPEILAVTADGVRLAPGSRQEYCPSSPAYREAVQRLVRSVAGRYADHPALAMWHVNNEYGCHVDACWCDDSARAFRDWLRRRYGSLDELNRAWTTAFWSQRYSDWSEVLPPRRTSARHNLTQLLDFQRFSSDAMLECFELERSILSELTPGVPVTTNFMGFFKPVDYWKWAQREDLVSNDAYPEPDNPAWAMKEAMAGDLMRSLRAGAPWLLMEQTTRRTVHSVVNVAKTPAQLRLQSYQAIARGSDGVMFFQWRQSRGGAELMQSAMVPQGSKAGSTIWSDVVRLGSELAELADLKGSRVEASVAIVFDWDSWWALEQPGQPSSLVGQVERLEAFYRPLYERNITVDFVPPGADLTSYRLIVVPCLFLIDRTAAENLTQYVRAGGQLVVSFFSGIVDQDDRMWMGGYPGALKEVLGVEVEDWRPLPPAATLQVRLNDGRLATADLWSELVLLQGAAAQAVFQGGVLDGQPALTEYVCGNGKSTYVATRLDASTLAQLLDKACDEAGIRSVARAGQGVEAVRRGEHLFLLDHRSGEVTVRREVPAKP
jgi:beta-galactosidase